MVPPVRIVGSYLSPYVRKILVALDLKRVAYEIDPIVPFLGDDRFTAVSPLRRVPVLIEGHGDNLSVGRSYRDAPEIDGLVLIPGRLPLGELVPVRIDGAMTYDLTGQPVFDDCPEVIALQTPSLTLDAVEVHR